MDEREVPADEVTAVFAQMGARFAPTRPAEKPTKKDRQPLDRLVDLEGAVADLAQQGVPASRVTRLEDAVTALAARVDAITRPKPADDKTDPTTPAAPDVGVEGAAEAAVVGPHPTSETAFYNGLRNLEAAGWKLQFTAPSA